MLKGIKFKIDQVNLEMLSKQRIKKMQKLEQEKDLEKLRPIQKLARKYLFLI